MTPPSNRIGIDPALMTQLIGEIKRLKQAWPDADAQIGRVLSSIGTSMTGPGTLSDVASQMAQQVPDLQRRLDLIVSTQKIGLDKGVIWADETLWASHSPASGAAAAKSVADQLREARKRGAFTSKDSLPSKILEQLEKHKNDPYFAVSFAQEMPPKELKTLLKDLYFADVSSLHKEWKEPPTSAVDKLVAALSVTLGTASRGVGDMKPPKGYVDELIATDDMGVSGTIVSNLLRYGAFDDTFLRDTANKVFDNLQRPRDEQQGIIGFTPGLAAALANNPRVAQDFFTDSKRKPLAFLMRKTYWGDGSKELGRAIEAATTTFRDNGQPPGTSRGYKSALIASWAVHFWADPKAQFALPDTRQSAARVFAAYIGDVNQISPQMPEYLGTSPMPDGDPTLPGKQPYGAVFGHDESKEAMTWAFKDPEALRTVMAGHGKYSVMVMDAEATRIAKVNRDTLDAWRRRHPEASKAEVEEQSQKILRDSMAGQTVQDFKIRVHNLSKSLHFIVDAGNMSEINAADAKDKTNKILKDVAVSTGKLMLTPYGWAVAGYEYIADNADPLIEFEEGKKARAKAETALETSETMFRDMTADAMMRHGLFGDDTAAATTHPHASDSYAKGSDRDFIRDGEILPRSAMTVTQRIAYENWLEYGPASGMFMEINKAVGDGFRPKDSN
ncbi:MULTISPECIES: hypothetical protein [unclassified Nonomuraea]|uniref:hypothetical protein n=1 Tax=unclassified Nonomuraea TaxID=2593643 RepID=UPI00340D4542